MVLEKVEEACKKGLSFGAATEAEVDMARLICSMDGAYGELRHGGGHERCPRGQRIYRKG